MNERLDPFDRKQVRSDTRYACAHAVEHPAQLLHVGLAGSVVDRRRPPGHDGGHDDVGRTRHRRLVEQHVAAAQLLAVDREELLGGVEIELGSQFLETDEMGVQPPPPDFVAARLGDVPHAEACQQRPDEHDRAAQPCAAAAVILGQQVVEVDLAGTERIGVVRQLLHLDPHRPQQIDELHDVQNPGHVVHDDPPGRQQRGAEDLQRFVLGPLRGDLAVKAVPAFDLKICHNP